MNGWWQGTWQQLKQMLQRGDNRVVPAPGGVQQTNPREVWTDGDTSQRSVETSSAATVAAVLPPVPVADAGPVHAPQGGAMLPPLQRDTVLRFRVNTMSDPYRGAFGSPGSSVNTLADTSQFYGTGAPAFPANSQQEQILGSVQTAQPLASVDGLNTQTGSTFDGSSVGGRVGHIPQNFVDPMSAFSSVNTLAPSPSDTGTGTGTPATAFLANLQQAEIWGSVQTAQPLASTNGFNTQTGLTFDGSDVSSGATVALGSQMPLPQPLRHVDSMNLLRMQQMALGQGSASPTPQQTLPPTSMVPTTSMAVTTSMASPTTPRVEQQPKGPSANLMSMQSQGHVHTR